MAGTTVSDNQITDECGAFYISSNSGSAFFNNFITYDMTTYHNGFQPDGGYDMTELIGSNNYNIGAGFVAVSGCPNDTSPSFCTLHFNSYGAEPTTHAASAPYVNPY